MKFKINRRLYNGVFSVQISHDGYGDETLSGDEEREIFRHLGFPLIEAGGLFQGNFGYDPATKKVGRDRYGSPVRIVMNSKKVAVDEGFQADFMVHIDRISEEDITPSLPSKEYIAEARCLLVEEEILSRIDEVIQGLKVRTIPFEEGYPKNTVL